MPEYIDREALIKFIADRLNNPDETQRFGHDAVEILAEIEFAPTVDVTPVVHGKWVGMSDGRGVCSNCNRQDGVDPLATHCRFCGAKMDLED